MVRLIRPTWIRRLAISSLVVAFFALLAVEFCVELVRFPFVFLKRVHRDAVDLITDARSEW